MTIELDHLMWGAPSLAQGMAEAERLFGVTPAPGGVHPGLGTQNALLSLGELQYLEIIAPDPNQSLEGNLGGRLAGLDAPGLITWAAAADRLSVLAERAAAADLNARGPVATSRQAPDGSLLKWELLFLGGHSFPGLMPFFIDWHNTPHPAGTNPLAGTFAGLIIRSPQANLLNDLFSALDLSIRAEADSRVELEALIDTPAGQVRLPKAPGSDGWSI